MARFTVPLVAGFFAFASIAAGIGLGWAVLGTPGFPEAAAPPAVVGAVALVAVGVYTAAQFPALAREERVASGTFAPVDAAGRATVGAPVVRQLAEALHARLAATPYLVLASDDAVRVQWDTQNPQYRAHLVSQHSDRAYTSTLALADARRPSFLRRDAWTTFDVATGLLHARAWASMEAGRVRRVERSGTLTWTRRGLKVEWDETSALDTRIVDEALTEALAQVGAKVSLGATARIGLAFGLLGAGSALLGVVVALASRMSGLG